MKKTVLLLLALFFVLFTTQQLLGQDSGDQSTYPPEVDQIDPYDVSAGDFLDTDIDALLKLANENYKNGDYELASKLYLAALRYNVDDSGNIYNLACCYGLLGEADLASLYLKRAFEAGWSDIEWAMSDPDFESVRDTDVMQATFGELENIVAESQANLGDLIWNSTEAYFECRMKLPGDFNPDEPHTLIVGLHGYGASPDSYIQLWDRFENPDFIFISPRAPYPSNQGYSWFTWSDDENERLWPKSAELTEDYVADVIMQMKMRYNIDKVYLLGFSQGCGLAYMAGMQHHDIIDGIICFGGWLDTDWIPESLITEASDSLRVFIAHGTEDTMVEFESGVTARDYLIDHGYDVTWYEFTGPHTVPEEALHEVELWLKE